MKACCLNFFLFFIGVLTPVCVWANTCLQAGPDTISTNTVITGSCIINGDLVIVSGGSLHVDLTGGVADTFVVRGNILLQGNGSLWINANPGSTSAQFIISNTSNYHRTITSKDSSQLVLENIDFRTQEGDLANAGSLYMSYDVLDHSLFMVNGCSLDPAKAWLLCNLKNKSGFTGVQANHLPTEIYVQDSAQMFLHGAASNIGIWLLFESTHDTLTVPNETGPYFSYRAGRGAGNIRSTWYLEIDSANPGLGVQIQPAAKLLVYGTGAPATGELKVNLLFANGIDTIENLQAGLQNGTVANGKIILNHVNLGPIAWQLYAVSNEALHISHSLVNEIGLVGPANTVVIDSSVLQLATLSALGFTGTSLTVSNSEIWGQAIVAANGTNIDLNNCHVTGSWLSADTASHIYVNGGCFFQNPAGCTPNTMVDINTGQPFCNPFIPAGYPRNLSPQNVRLIGVGINCITSINDIDGGNNPLVIYPNPCSFQTTVFLNPGERNASLIVYNALGQQVKHITQLSGDRIILYRNALPAGLYVIQLLHSNDTVTMGKLMITDN